MRKILKLIAILVIVFNNLEAQNVSDIIEKSMSGVVTVTVYKKDTIKVPNFKFKGQADKIYQKLDLRGVQIKGSGFIIQKGKKKYIITNSHVIEHASKAAGSIYIYTINKNKYEVKITGVDIFYDIAVLEFIKEPDKATGILSFNSTEARIGEGVYAIGNPLGEYPYTVTNGIISAKNRLLGGVTNKFGYLQTTASFAEGNSGGPLINTSGKVVGVTTLATYDFIKFANYSELLSLGDTSKSKSKSKQEHEVTFYFALEGTLCNKIVTELIKYGQLRRAFIGIELSQRYIKNEVFDKCAKNEKIKKDLIDSLPVISSIIPNTPAHKALRQYIGYSVYKINDEEVRNIEEALELFEKVNPGDSVKLSLWIKGYTINVYVKTDELNRERLEATANIILQRNNININNDSNDTSGFTFKALNKRNKANQILAAGDENEESAWRIENLSELGMILRFYGLEGYCCYIHYRNNKKDPSERRDTREINFSDEPDNYFSLSLWY